MGSNKNKRLNILTQAEIDEFSATPSFSEAEKDHYFSLSDDETSFLTGRESPEMRAAFILFLGYFKFRPIVLSPTLDDIEADFEHICARYFPDEALTLTLPTPMQRSRIYEKVFAASKTKRFTTTFRQQLLDKALRQVRIDTDRRVVLDALITFIYFHETELPKYYVFQDVISEAVHTEESRVGQLTSQGMSPGLQEVMDKFVDDEGTHSALGHVKKQPRTFSRNDFSPELHAFEIIKPVYPDLQQAVHALAISKGNVSYYASLVDRFSVSRLRQVALTTRRVYLLCYLYHRFQLINDNLLQASIFNVRKLAADAKSWARERIVTERHEIEAKLAEAADVLDLFGQAHEGDPPFSAVQGQAYAKLSVEDLATVSAFMRTLSLNLKQFEWEYIDKHRQKVRGFIRKLFMSLEFVDSTDSPRFMTLFNGVREQLSAHGDVRMIDLRSIPKAVRPFLVDGAGQLISHRAEFYIYQGVQRRLDNCQWYVKNSGRYEPFEQDLVDEKDWEQNKFRLTEEVNLSSMQTPPEDLLEPLLAGLEIKLARVAAAAEQQEMESVVLTKKDGNRKWTVKRLPKEEDVNNPFFRKMRKIEITDVLALVSRETGFFQEIRHIKGRSTRPDDLGIFMACLIANATRFGTYRMAEICNYSYDVLSTFQGNYMRVETLNNAIDRIHNATAKLKIFKHYSFSEGVVHASSDGQKFTTRKNTLRTRYSTKHFGQGKGLSAYTMNANHLPLAGRIGGLNDHESHFAFDILYNNTSDVKPDVLSTDNHGVNRFNFAIIQLSGLVFAPRFADFGAVIDRMFQINESSGTLQLKLKKPINVKKIVDQWDFIRRIIVSLHQKETSQANLVRKMSRSAASNRLLTGLAEYDRLIRAHYVLDLMEDPVLRKYVQRALNRGEAYHSLQRAIEHINGDPGFRGESDREIDEWHACARMLASCIIYFNSAVLSALLDIYERQGRGDMAELVKAVSPVAWLHINLNGNYSFDSINHQLDLMEVIQTLAEAL